MLLLPALFPVSLTSLRDVALSWLSSLSTLVPGAPSGSALFFTLHQVGGDLVAMFSPREPVTSLHHVGMPYVLSYLFSSWHGTLSSNVCPFSFLRCSDTHSLPLPIQAVGHLFNRSWQPAPFSPMMEATVRIGLAPLLPQGWQAAGCWLEPTSSSCWAQGLYACLSLSAWPFPSWALMPSGLLSVIFSPQHLSRNFP